MFVFSTDHSVALKFVIGKKDCTHVGPLQVERLHPLAPDLIVWIPLQDPVIIAILEVAPSEVHCPARTGISWASNAARRRSTLSPIQTVNVQDLGLGDIVVIS